MKIVNPVDLIVVNRNNQILLVKRTEEEDDYKDTWSIPGGWSEIDENFEDAIHREIKEELCCTISNYKYFKSYVMKLDNDLIGRAVYFYWEIEGEILLNHELSEFKWFDINDPNVFKLDFAYNQDLILKDFVEFWNNWSKF